MISSSISALAVLLSQNVYKFEATRSNPAPIAVSEVLEERERFQHVIYIEDEHYFTEFILTEYVDQKIYLLEELAGTCEARKVDESQRENSLCAGYLSLRDLHDDSTTLDKEKADKLLDLIRKYIDALKKASLTRGDSSDALKELAKTEDILLGNTQKSNEHPTTKLFSKGGEEASSDSADVTLSRSPSSGSFISRLSEGTVINSVEEESGAEEDAARIEEEKALMELGMVQQASQNLHEKNHGGLRRVPSTDSLSQNTKNSELNDAEKSYVEQRDKLNKIEPNEPQEKQFAATYLEFLSKVNDINNRRLNQSCGFN